MSNLALEGGVDIGFSVNFCRTNDMLLTKGAKQPSYRKNGTTCVGLIFESGVILGADGKGPIVCDEGRQKIYYLAQNIYFCGAGSAAETEAVSGIVSSQLGQVRYNTEEESTVVTAISHLKSHLFKYQGNVSAPVILGGVDVTGPHLHTIYDHSATSTVSFATMGSGSLAAMSVFESKYRKELTMEEGVKLVIEAICSGIFDNLGSRSIVVCVLTKGHNNFMRIHKPVESLNLCQEDWIKMLGSLRS